MILGSRPTLRVTFDSLYSCGSNFWLKHKYASRGGSQFLRPYLSFAILQEINTYTECSGCPIFSLKMCLPSQRHYWTWFSIFWDPSIIRLTLRCQRVKVARGSYCEHRLQSVMVCYDSNVSHWLSVSLIMCL